VQEIENKIKEYIANFDDAVYVSSIFAVVDAPAVIETLKVILGSGDKTSTLTALTFIRDVRLGGCVVTEDIRAEFSTLLPELFPAFRGCVFSENYFIRSQGIYTIGKLCNRENIPTLVEAFESFKTTDPLSIPGLFFELGWLGSEELQDLITEMTNHPNYLFRWATLQFFDSSKYQIDSEGHNFVKEQLAILQNDENKLVRAEANHLYARILLSEKQPNMVKAEFKAEVKSIKKIEPEITFVSITTGFHNYLSVAMKSNYTVEELDLFTQQYSVWHKLKSNEDFIADIIKLQTKKFEGGN